MGDYQRDTNRLTTLEHGAYFLLLQECWVHGQIPLEPAERAKIAKMSLRQWEKIAPRIDPYFLPDGTNKRASAEIEKAENIRIKRAIAGQRGGYASGTSKAIAKQTASKWLANAEANSIAKSKPSVANHNHNIENTSTDRVERAEVSADGSVLKRPAEVSRSELAEIYAKRSVGRGG